MKKYSIRQDSDGITLVIEKKAASLDELRSIRSRLEQRYVSLKEQVDYLTREIEVVKSDLDDVDAAIGEYLRLLGAKA
jgi:uncharacterized coiled-coil DUF342 family protein